MHHPFCDAAIITANSHRNVTGHWFFTLEMSQFCDISETQSFAAASFNQSPPILIELQIIIHEEEIQKMWNLCPMPKSL